MLTLDEHATALVSAALRHVRDAEALLGKEPTSSPDQAFHLAGYGPECARKAALSSRALDIALGHEFGADVLETALALDVHALRYDLAHWNTRHPALRAWSTGARYKRTGTYTDAQATELVKAARAAVDRIVVALWSDGAFPTGQEPW